MCRATIVAHQLNIVGKVQICAQRCKEPRIQTFVLWIKEYRDTQLEFSLQFEKTCTQPVRLNSVATTIHKIIHL